MILSILMLKDLSIFDRKNACYISFFENRFAYCCLWRYCLGQGFFLILVLDTIIIILRYFYSLDILSYDLYQFIQRVYFVCRMVLHFKIWVFGRCLIWLLLQPYIITVSRRQRLVKIRLSRSWFLPLKTFSVTKLMVVQRTRHAAEGRNETLRKQRIFCITSWHLLKNII